MEPDLGLPDPGALTTLGLPAVRALAELRMAVTIGGLLFAAFLVAPQRSGYIDVAGYLGLRVTSWGAAAWAVTALLAVPLTVADTFGRPVADVLDVAILIDLVPRIPTALAWALTGLAALGVLLGARSALSWRWTVVVFGASVLGPLPVAVSGHSRSGGSHDLATSSLVLHLLAAAFWVGGLIALVILTVSRERTCPAVLVVAVPRFSRLALAGARVQRRGEGSTLLICEGCSLC